MCEEKWWSGKGKYALCFLLGLIVLFLRSAYTVSVPTMYTEDGAWISAIINNGFWDTLLHARSDYLVAGNILSLEFALLLNQLFCGDNLSYLPNFVAFVQYMLLSAAALLPIICFKDDLRKPLQYLLWFCILMVPVGESGVEIFGKVSNIGYLFYFIAFCLLYYRITQKENLSKGAMAAVDILLLICCGTHPGCYLLVGLGFLVDTIGQYRQLSLCYRDWKEIITHWISCFCNQMWVILGILCTIMAAYDLFCLTGESPESIPLLQNGFRLPIELFARELLFYLIYPVYRRLNDKVVVILFFLVCITLVYLFCFAKLSRREKQHLFICLCGTLLYCVITTAARGGMLMSYLNQYTTTWVDRYYYGLNIMTLIPIGFVLEYLLRQKVVIAKAIGGFVSVYMLLCPLFSLPYLFDFTKPNTLGLTHIVPFSQRIKEAVYDADKDRYIVPIDFEGWSMELPARYYFATLQDSRSMQECTVVDFTGDGWSAGVGDDGSLLFDWFWYDTLETCDMLSAGGKTVKVLELQDYNGWLRAICDTRDLTQFAYPNIVTYTKEPS